MRMKPYALHSTVQRDGSCTVSTDVLYVQATETIRCGPVALNQTVLCRNDVSVKARCTYDTPSISPSCFDGVSTTITKKLRL